MGSAERMRVAAELTAREQRPVVAIVSAMSKVTDLLIDSLKKAEKGDQGGLEENLKVLAARHQDTARALLPAEAQEAALHQVNELIGEFERIARGMLMLGERPPRSVDQAIAIGERLSAHLLASYLESRGIRAQAVNAATVIATDDVFGNASPLMEETRDRAEHVLGPLLRQKILPIVTGFNGSTLDHRPTTLGRGGSDFSASIIAAALEAEELWIWTDVDGIMSADPRLVADAKVLEEVTYAEAAELAYNGAKVLHPRTLAPLVERKIPVWSKNSFAPEKPGTHIVPAITGSLGPRAVTSMADVALVSLEPTSGELSGTKVLARALETLDRLDVELLALTSSSYRQTFCFLVRKAELDATLEALRDEFALELAHDYLHPIDVDPDVGLLAIVGEGMRGTAGLAGRIFSSISKENINIIAIAQGSSELTIATVVRRAGLEAAVRAVHQECGLGR